MKGLVLGIATSLLCTSLFISADNGQSTNPLVSRGG